LLRACQPRPLLDAVNGCVESLTSDFVGWLICRFVISAYRLVLVVTRQCNGQCNGTVDASAFLDDLHQVCYRAANADEVPRRIDAGVRTLTMILDSVAALITGLIGEPPGARSRCDDLYAHSADRDPCPSPCE
jgi:hypothetical protein